MQLNLMPFLVFEVVLIAIVLGMVVWRMSVARHEDDTLHVMHGPAPSEQSAVAQKLEVIDKWGKILTAVTVLVGLLVGAAYVYQNWVTASKVLE